MTKSEIAKLLARCAVYDQRTVGEADVEGWFEIASDEDWTADAAHRVVREYYSRGAERPRIRPAAITDRLREMRHKAADSFREPDARDDETGREYVERKRALIREHVAQVMDTWATTGEIPDPSAALQSSGGEVRELTTGLNMTTCPPGLRDQITRDARHIGRRIPREAS